MVFILSSLALFIKPQVFMTTTLPSCSCTKTLKKNRINVVTLGCSKNVYDSEVLMGQLKASGKDVVHEQEGNSVVPKY